MARFTYVRDESGKYLAMFRCKRCLTPYRLPVNGPYDIPAMSCGICGYHDFWVLGALAYTGNGNGEVRVERKEYCPCTASCLHAIKSDCDCPCGGSNHGLGWAGYFVVHETRRVAMPSVTPKDAVKNAKLMLAMRELAKDDPWTWKTYVHCRENVKRIDTRVRKVAEALARNRGMSKDEALRLILELAEKTELPTR